VWDATTGTKQYTFEGHEAPVYSVCPHYKESIQVIDLLDVGRYPLYLFIQSKRHTFIYTSILISLFIFLHHLLLKIQFIFSTALDGKIKAWLYDNMGSRVDYDAPGHWCTTMAYSADGTR